VNAIKVVPPEYEMGLACAEKVAKQRMKASSFIPMGGILLAYTQRDNRDVILN
jgi:hypothetical protein